MSKATTNDSAAAAAEIVHANAVEVKKDLQPIVAGLPTDIHSLKLLSHRLNREAAEAMFEQGRVLTAIKHQSDHGDFMDHVEELGISHSWANAMMQFARQCIELKVASKGRIDFDLVNKLGTSKATLFVSAMLDAPDEIPTTKRDAKAKVEEFDAMSVRELKQLIKDQRRQLESRDKKLKDGSEQLDKLRDRLDAYTEATPTVISEACTSLSRTLKDAIEGFANSVEKRDSNELPEATVLALASLKTELRVAAKQVIDLLDDQFPEIADLELHSAEILAPVEDMPSLLNNAPSRNGRSKRTGN